MLAFLPASDSLFGSRLIFFNKVILRGVITASFSATWEQRNLESEYPEIRFVNNSWSGGGGALFYQAVFGNDATISGLQPSFLIQQHKGKRMLWCEGRICRYSKPVKSQQLAVSESPITMVTTCLSVLSCNA